MLCRKSPILQCSKCFLHYRSEQVINTFSSSLLYTENISCDCEGPTQSTILNDWSDYGYKEIRAKNVYIILSDKIKTVIRIRM
jgi:hypothetical protein